jgi:hypothetical protein
MTEESNEETETTELSTQRKVAIVVTTTLVTLAVGIAASCLSEKINDQIRKKMKKTDE